MADEPRVTHDDEETYVAGYLAARGIESVRPRAWLTSRLPAAVRDPEVYVQDLGDAAIFLEEPIQRRRRRIR